MTKGQTQYQGKTPDWCFMVPPMIAGRFYAGMPQAQAVSTLAPTASTLYFMPFWNPRPITWVTIAIEVTSGVAGTARLGYYNADVEGRPHLLKRDFGTVDVTSNAVVSLTINEVTSQGLYFLSYISSVSPTLRSLTHPSWSAPLPGSTLTDSLGGSFFRSDSMPDFVTALPYRVPLSLFNVATALNAPRILIGV